MIPYYPENTKQLQQHGILDMGMRMLQASGPAHQGMGFGARLGGAGVDNLTAMRGAGQQMQQMQMLQAKQAQAKSMQDMRTRAATSYEGAAMNRGPLSPRESSAVDVGMANILGGKQVGDFSTDTLFPDASAQKAQSPIGKINADFKSGIINKDQFEAEVKDRYKSSGSEKVYEMKLRHLTELGVPRDISVKVLSGMYKSVSDPLAGTVVIDLDSGAEIGRIVMGEGWVQNKARNDPMGIR